MGLNSTAYIKGKVSHNDIFDYIKKCYDINVSTDIKTKVYDDEIAENVRSARTAEQIFSDTIFHTNGHIYFCDKDWNVHKLYYNYDSFSDPCIGEESSSLEGLESAELTYLSMGYVPNSVEIMKDLLEHFGGGLLSECDATGPDYSVYPNKEN